MERSGFCAAGPHKSLGKDVLPAVLLEVIDSPIAIKGCSNHLTGVQRSLSVDHMEDSAGFVFEDVDNGPTSDLSGIMGLAASRWIKGGLVENELHSRVAGPCVYYGGTEFKKGGIYEV
jgi:hypothetical protein